MIIQIKLEQNSNVGSLINGEPFVLVENEVLQIEFAGEIENVLIVSLKNEDIKRQILVERGKFTVHKDLLKEGRLEMIVSLYNASGIAARWICEPITLVKPREDVFEGYPVIASLQARISDLEAEVHLLQETVADLQNQTSRLWELAES